MQKHRRKPVKKPIKLTVTGSPPVGKPIPPIAVALSQFMADMDWGKMRRKRKKRAAATFSRAGRPKQYDEPRVNMYSCRLTATAKTIAQARGGNYIEELIRQDNPRKFKTKAQRPRDYATLTPEAQWAIDKGLGILDEK